MSEIKTSGLSSADINLLNKNVYTMEKQKLY